MQHQQLIVCVALGQNGNLLLVQEGKAPVRGLWNIPSGHVDPGENLLQAAIREVKEETNLEITITGLMGIENTRSRNGTTQNLKLLFSGEIIGGTRKADGEEILATQWMPFAAVLPMGDQLRSPQTIALALERLQTHTTYPLDIIRDYL